MVSLEPKHLPAGVDGELIAAAHKGDVEAAKRAVEAGGSLSAVDSEYGFCALTWAANEGQHGVAQYLVTLGSNPNAQAAGAIQADYNGTSALMRGARNGHLAVVSALLNAGANANAVDVDAYTALIYAGQGQEASYI